MKFPPNIFESPWLSLHNPSLPEEDRADFSALLESLHSQDCKTAIEGWTHLVQIDKWRADAWYGLGILSTRTWPKVRARLPKCTRTRYEPRPPHRSPACGPFRARRRAHHSVLSFDRSHDFGKAFFTTAATSPQKVTVPLRQSFEMPLLHRAGHFR